MLLKLSMKKILPIFLVIILFPIVALAWSGKVVGVTDGDTIKVIHPTDGQVKIRLYGIDTPEKGQAYGQAATKHLASLIAGTTLEVESITADRYGRTVAIVWSDESNINEQMVSSGYAWVYRKYCDKPFCEYWLALEDKARSSRIGLWQESNLGVAEGENNG